MSRSLTLRASIVALALLPAFSACTVTMNTGGEQATPAESPAATQPGDQASGQASTEATNASSTAPDGSSTQNSASAEGSTGSTNPGANTTASEPAGQKVAVPGGRGLSRLDVIDIYGAPASGGAHGRITAVFKAETDRPLMLNIRIRLFDKAGNEIAENTGLNSVYTVGPQYLVTTNLIELPKGKTPETFKAELVDITDMGRDFSITKMPMPTVATSSKSAGVQTLKGTVTIKGAMKGTVEAEGACIMPDGKIYQGTDTLTDNPVNGNSVAYEIPMYDADGVDLTKAQCYTSA